MAATHSEKTLIWLLLKQHLPKLYLANINPIEFLIWTQVKNVGWIEENISSDSLKIKKNTNPFITKINVDCRKRIKSCAINSVSWFIFAAQGQETCGGEVSYADDRKESGDGRDLAARGWTGSCMTDVYWWILKIKIISLWLAFICQIDPPIGLCNLSVSFLRMAV